MRSLLWPSGRPPGPTLARLDLDAVRDLELDRVADTLAEQRPDRRASTLDALIHLPSDAATVRWRAGAMADLLASPPLCDRLEAAAGALRLVGAHRPQAFGREVPRAARIGARVVELGAYVEAVRRLHDALAGEEARSVALRALRDDVAAAAGAAEFRALEAEVPRWRRTLDEVRSVTVAINVSPAMEPESATIVGFSARPTGGDDAALARMLGEPAGARGLVRLFRKQPVDWQGGTPLAADVQALLEAVAAPVERALGGFRLVQAQAVAHLEDELVLLLAGARMGRRWRAEGLPCCLAEVDADEGPGPGAPPGAARPRRDTGVEGAFHPVLAAALRPPSQVVCNDVTFGETARVWVLTGPNRGGKTSYLRAVGVVQVLGQCGLPVPARRARLRVVDRLFTHFPSAEAGRPGEGRLDEEAARVARVFATCTARSLVLLNEVLAGTSAAEGVALAADVLRGFRAVGCDVVYATHLHELAMRCADVNGSIDGPGRVASLTVETALDPESPSLVRRPTYRVLPGAPAGASFFASLIARQHGIDLPHLLEGLRARGVVAVPPPEAAARPEGSRPPGGPAS